jgi:recombination protein RecT
MGLTAYLTQDAVKNQINSVIGGKDGQRFITAVVSAVNTNPMLQECSNQSILSAALLGESLKLSPSPQLGHYYIVPYKDKNRGMVGQFQMGYKGLIQLAIRSGQYKKLNVLAIKEGELVKFDALNEDIEVNLIEDEEKRENTPTVGYYAMFEYVNGFRKAIYWSRSKMERHALRYSKGYQAKKGYTFWEKDFDAMAYKTMLRQLISKWGIMSIDMISAVEKDMSVIQPDGSAVYVDNEPEDATEVVTTAEVVEAEVEKPANDVQAALFG